MAPGAWAPLSFIAWRTACASEAFAGLARQRAAPYDPRMGRLIIAFALLALLAGRAWASFDDGKAAFARGDWAAALAQWRPCADAGDAACQNGLGALYRLGRGVQQDLPGAADWFRKAAEQGFAKAQTNLADMYVEGAG